MTDHRTRQQPEPQVLKADSRPRGVNWIVESFWSRMQVQLLDRKKWRIRLEPANAILEYPETWHSRETSPRTVKWLTPTEFERNDITTMA